jgi:hypothetical protein
MWGLRESVANKLVLDEWTELFAKSTDEINPI